MKTYVLAIEDNPDFAQIFGHLLEVMGCELKLALDAHSGLEIARRTLPDVIFCDIGLPGDMSGLDFARALRVIPQLAHTPLIAVSGYTSEEDCANALQAGFDKVLPKPVKFTDVNDVLSALRK